MRRRVIYDPGEPVVVRDYELEVAAMLDQSLLEAAEIPSIVRYDRYAEIPQRVFLVVRREHLKEAREILCAT